MATPKLPRRAGIITTAPLPKRTIRKARKAVQRIVIVLQTYLKLDTDIVVSEIIEGGSLGHGTAFPGNFDIDLVIYSRDITVVQICDNKLREIVLLKIEKCLKKRLKGNYEHTSFTPYAVQCKYLFSPGCYIEVDLLISTYWESPTQLSDYITEHCPDNPYQLSAGASKWQTKFMKSQNSRIKEYVKRAKFWRNNVDWQEGKYGRPSSYLLSLLVVKAYEKVGIHVTGKSHPRLKRQAANNVTKALHELVKNHTEMKVLFYEYNFTVSPPHPPCITDPANICNNLYETGIGKPRNDDPNIYWDTFAAKIDSLDLSIPLEQMGFFRSKSMPNLFFQ